MEKRIPRKFFNLIYLYKEVLKKWDSCKRHRNLKKTNDQHVLSYVFLYSTFPFNVKLDLEKK